MYAPKLNINGTSYEQLMEQYNQAIEELRRAVKVLLETSPHPRDYVHAAAGEYRAAQSQHLLRVDALGRVMRELGELRDDVHTQQLKREEMKRARPSV